MVPPIRLLDLHPYSDSASFGGVQAFSPFIREFGSYNATTKKYALPAPTTSLMNSLPLLGKFLGTIVVGPLTERFGHRYTMALTCLIQIIGAVSKLHTAATRV